MPSPRGNSPRFKPSINRVRPSRTRIEPMMIEPKLGIGCCRTASWKNAITSTIGSRSRVLSARDEIRCLIRRIKIGMKLFQVVYGLPGRIGLMLTGPSEAVGHWSVIVKQYLRLPSASIPQIKES
jgi:hypothetical protein